MVGGGERVVVRDVDFVLTGAVLVVRRGHRHAHRAQRGDDCVACLFTAVVRRKIEIGSDVRRCRRRRVAVASFEEIELDLEPDAVTAQLRRALYRASQRGSRAAFEGRAVGHGNVANQSSLAAVGRGTPRIDRERRKIGTQQHIELFPAHETVDRSAVEGDASVERRLDLVDRNRDVLADPEDIRKDQAHEANAAFARQFDDVALSVRTPSLRSCREVHRLQPPNVR